MKLTNQEWMDGVDTARFLRWMTRTKRQLPSDKEQLNDLVYAYLAVQRRRHRREVKQLLRERSE